METMLWVAVSAIPCVIACKRKCASFVLIDLLSFFLSWTIIGCVIAMAWAMGGESDPRKFAQWTAGVKRHNSDYKVRRKEELPALTARSGTSPS